MQNNWQLFVLASFEVCDPIEEYNSNQEQLQLHFHQLAIHYVDSN